MYLRIPIRLAVTLLVTAAVVLSGEPLIGVSVAHAQNLGLSGSFIVSTQFLVSTIITALNFLTWMVFMLLDVIMNPTWIFDLQANNADGSLVNMLRNIWQLCRDIVNLILALVLIAQAIMMIVTADASKIKEKLPKFVMALILVNFSWFIPRAIFDLSQVMTYTMYQLPSLVGADGCTLPPAAGQTERTPCEIVVGYRFFEETKRIGVNGIDTVDGSTGWVCPVKYLACIQTVPIDEANDAVGLQMHSKVLNGLIVNHARLRSLIFVSDPRPGGVGPAGANNLEGAALFESFGYLVKLVVILILHIAIFFPILALAAAFFLRIPILWVTMAFMPLVALSYVIGDEHMEDFKPKELFMNQFLSAVFLPVKIAIPFSIGFIMLNAAATADPPEVIRQMTPVAVFTNVYDVWQILWMVIALFIIWKYSFQVLKKDEIMGMFSEKIESFGRNLGSVAAKWPLSLPFIPAPGGKAGEKTSLLQLKNAYDPARLNQRLDALGVGGSGHERQREAEQVHEVREKIHGNGQLKADIKVRIDQAKAAGNVADRVRAMNEALNRFKGQHPELRNINERLIVEAILEEFTTDLTPEEKERIKQAMQAQVNNP